MEPPAYRGFAAVHGEKAGVFHAMRPLTPRRRRARPVRRLPAGKGRRRRLRRRDLLRAAPVHRLLALGRRALVPARRQVPADHGRRGAGPAEAAAAAAVRRFADRSRARPTTSASSCSRSRRSRLPRASSGPARASSASSASSTCARTCSGEEPTYERLLGDAMAGDGSLFTSQDAVEAAWAVVDRCSSTMRRRCPMHPAAGGPGLPTR